MSDNNLLQPLKGFRDFIGFEAKKRFWLQNQFRQVFEKNGFEPLETPALEYASLLLGKYGDEADKLVYTFTDNGGRKVALRYDQTVPTARVIATNKDSVPIPWKRYQIQPVWRSEKPQKGRYREFLQCDIDIFGTDSLIADAQIMATTMECFQSIKLQNVKILLNDRTILFSLIRASGIEENMIFSVIQSIDKLDKKSEEDVKEELKEKGINENSISKLFSQIQSTQPNQRLKTIIKYLELMGIDESQIEFRPYLARGLDYYTSTIFEFIVKNTSGSIAGGGRYDNLIGKLSGNPIVAVGIAFGFDRVLEIATEQKLIPDNQVNSQILVSIFNEELASKSIELTTKLLKNGLSAELYSTDNVKLDKQFKYAEKKQISTVIVIGPDEAKNNTVTIKNMKDRTQETLSIEQLIEKLSK